MPSGDLTEILTLLSLRREIRNKPVTNYKEVTDFEVVLSEDKLWTEFEKLKKQIIVSGNGSTFEPPLNITVKGLKPSVNYWVAMEIAQLGNQSYYYDKEKERWEMNEGGCLPPLNNVLLHPESPQLGSAWLSKIIKFDKCLLSTGLESIKTIGVNINHKYEVRIHLLTSTLEFHHVACQSLPKTEFIAVSCIKKIKNISDDMVVVPTPLNIKLPRNTVLEPINPVVGKGARSTNNFIHQTKLPKDTVLEAIISSPGNLKAVSESSFENPAKQVFPNYVPHEIARTHFGIVTDLTMAGQANQVPPLIPIAPTPQYGHYPNMQYLPSLEGSRNYMPSYQYPYGGYSSVTPTYSWPYFYETRYPNYY